MARIALVDVLDHVLNLLPVVLETIVSFYEVSLLSPAVRSLVDQVLLHVELRNDDLILVLFCGLLLSDVFFLLLEGLVRSSNGRFVLVFILQGFRLVNYHTVLATTVHLVDSRRFLYLKFVM